VREVGTGRPKERVTKVANVAESMRASCSDARKRCERARGRRERRRNELGWTAECPVATKRRIIERVTRRPGGSSRRSEQTSTVESRRSRVSRRESPSDERTDSSEGRIAQGAILPSGFRRSRLATPRAQGRLPRRHLQGARNNLLTWCFSSERSSPERKVRFSVSERERSAFAKQTERR